jgi:hypothetical protein
MKKQSPKPTPVIVQNPVVQQLQLLQTLADTNKILAQKAEVCLSLLSVNSSNNTISDCSFNAAK